MSAIVFSASSTIASNCRRFSWLVSDDACKIAEETIRAYLDSNEIALDFSWPAFVESSLLVGTVLYLQVVLVDLEDGQGRLRPIPHTLMLQL